MQILTSREEIGDGVRFRDEYNLSDISSDEDTNTEYETTIDENDQLYSTVWYSPSALGNYEPVEQEKSEGPGAGGAPLHVEGARDNFDLYDYGMSMTTSDTIALDRSVKDVRSLGCKHWNYPTELPSASVVLVFHNEGLSVLLRTVVSIINRSPPHLLAEVLLVDDYSDQSNYPHLGQQLDDWVAEKDKVRLIRNDERQGLIRSKNRGAEESVGEIVVFLDAHCEVNSNWLPPLLAPIKTDPHTLTVPLVDMIDYTTFAYSSIYPPAAKPVGIWEWGLLYKEMRNELPDVEDEEALSTAYESPLHAGGLIAVNREYFLKIGGYDPGLLVWGGEQYELSFKIWMCGGRIIWVPCSRVGHVYRAMVPYGFGKLVAGVKGADVINTNLKRVVETWFDDEHKQYFYTRQPLARYLDHGDITAQLMYRRTCRSFSWFMTNVASNVYEDFPRLPQNVFWGQIKWAEDNDACWRPRCKEPPCKVETSTDCFIIHDEVLRLNVRGQLGLGERCLTTGSLLSGENWGMEVVIGVCPLGSVGDKWSYDVVERRMKYEVKTGTGGEVSLCAEMRGMGQVIVMAVCDKEEDRQRWVWEEYVPYWA